MDVEINTPRLTLRSLAEADIPALVAGLNDYEITRYLTMVPYPYSEADAQSWISSRPRPVPGKAHFAIDMPGKGMIGSVALDSELGYWLSASCHGNGFMTEACVALLDWHFAAKPDDVVPSGAHLGNAPSLNVQRKLGFVEVSRSMRFAKSHGRDVEHVETKLTRSQFETARQLLGRR